MTDAEKEECAEILGRTVNEIEPACDALTATQLTRLSAVLVEWRKVANRYAVLQSDGITADAAEARRIYRMRIARILGFGDASVGFIGTA